MVLKEKKSLLESQIMATHKKIIDAENNRLQWNEDTRKCESMIKETVQIIQTFNEHIASANDDSVKTCLVKEREKTKKKLKTHSETLQMRKKGANKNETTLQRFDFVLRNLQTEYKHVEAAYKHCVELERKADMKKQLQDIDEQNEKDENCIKRKREEFEKEIERKREALNKAVEGIEKRIEKRKRRKTELLLQRDNINSNNTGCRI